jgi:hypothetical protein
MRFKEHWFILRCGSCGKKFYHRFIDRHVYMKTSFKCRCCGKIVSQNDGDRLFSCREIPVIEEGIDE